MSQHDYNLANASGPAFRADLNAALAAIATQNAAAVAPTPPFANQMWYDTSTGWVKKRNNANTAWVNFFQLADNGALTLTSIYPLAAPALQNMSGANVTVSGIRADARRISMHVHQMTTTGSFPNIVLYLSTAAGIHTSGYGGRRFEATGASVAEVAQTPTTFFEPINNWSAALNAEMTLSLRNATAQQWSLHLWGLGGRWRQYWGHVDLPAVLTGFRWEPAGAQTFTGGTLSYMVE